jgi:hypothetical protein
MVVKQDEWKENWENYLKTREVGEKEPIQLNLRDIDFYIPPLLGIDAESMNSIRKHNAKIGIF